MGLALAEVVQWATRKSFTEKVTFETEAELPGIQRSPQKRELKVDWP